MQPLLRFVQWEEELYSFLEADLEICRSDAQGMADAKPHLIRDAWNAGLTAREAATQIIHAITPEDRAHD